MRAGTDRVPGWTRRPAGGRPAAARLALAALVLPLLAAAAVEAGITLFVASAVEEAARAAARLPIAPAADPQGDRLDALRRLIAERTHGLVDAGRVRIDVLAYPSFAAIGQPEPFADANGNGVRDPGEAYADLNRNGRWDADQGSAGAGDAGDIYRIRYRTRDLTGLARPILGPVTRTATVAVRNEPY